MPELHLRQPGFTFSACGPFTKNKERIEKVMQIGDTNYIDRNDLDKVCFYHDMASAKYKDLTKRTQSDKVLKDKAFVMVFKFFDKKSKGGGIKSMSNKQLANKLHKLIIRKFKRRKVYTSHKDGTWGCDLADMQLISKYNEKIMYLLCVIDIFSKYAWAVLLKDKKGITIVNAFQKLLKESSTRSDKIWVDQGSEVYNKSFEKMLEDNNIKMYSTYNEGKSIVAGRFIRTLKK